MPSRLCASVLNDTFVTAFSSSRTLPESPELRSKNYFPMDPIIFNATGISAIIKKLKPKSSCGVDEINSKILKNAREYCSMILECIFSQSYHLHALPRDWTTNKVTPVFKSGDSQTPSNYRPISLTSVLQNYGAYYFHTPH